ncbi:MAG: hypothetical protein ACT4R6_03085 [Gemmatimonadaceae bacterium]
MRPLCCSLGTGVVSSGPLYESLVAGVIGSAAVVLLVRYRIGQQWAVVRIVRGASDK